MSYECRIEKDSINQWGQRLTTFEVTFPRMVLAEFNTHRVLSRNSASSRAIPVEKQIAKIENDLFLPVFYWGKNQKGMQADQELTEWEIEFANKDWKTASRSAIGWAKSLVNLGVHTQITNRLLEPFMWHTAVVTATEWDNAFHQRRHRDAQPEIRRIFNMMGEVIAASSPRALGAGMWHLPYVDFDDEIAIIPEHNADPSFLPKVSAGRSARVSYLTQNGVRDFRDDLGLFARLATSGHMSPLEHPCRPMTEEEHQLFERDELVWNGERFVPTGKKTYYLGNVQGWVQLRKLIPHEADALGAR